MRKLLLLLICLGPILGSGQSFDKALSAYTEDKDTLFLPDHSMGRLIKEAWDSTNVPDPPRIFLLERKEWRDLISQNELIVNVSKGKWGGKVYIIPMDKGRVQKGYNK